MANEGSTRLTTDQLKAMIASGATREQLPASGSSVSSTVDSAQRAYLAAQQKVARTAAFKLAQTQTARQFHKLERHKDNP
jgi:precorrin isomerase